MLTAEPASPVTTGNHQDRRARLAAAAGRLRSGCRHVLPAIGLYLGLRLVSLVTFALIARSSTKVGVMGLLRSWDGKWYLMIAQHGYAHAFMPSWPGHPPLDGRAFFPLYPLLIRVTAFVLPIGPSGAGLMIALLAGMAAAAGIFAVGHQQFGYRTGMLAAALWAVLPHSIVESMLYTEALFAALAAWSLYAALGRHWLTACVLAGLCGLTRPTAVALLAAVGLAALLAGVRRQDGWRPWAAIAIMPLGLLGYLTWVAVQTGRWDGYLWVQRNGGWTMHFDAGAYTVRHFVDVATGKHAVHDIMYPATVDLQRTGFLVTDLLLLAFLVLLILQYLRRDALPLLVFSTLSMVTVLGSAAYYASKPRHLLPVFTLLYPLAAVLANCRRRSLAVGLTALALVSGWYAAYLLIFFGWVAL